jgi:hypothetical protein
MDNWKETSLLHRTLRTTFILTLLIGLTILVSISPINAASHSAHAANAANAGRSFQANGHGQVVGRRLNTATTPYVKGTGPGVLPARPAPGGIAHVPSPANVAKAPAPTHSPTNIVIKTSFAGQSYTGWVPSDSNGTAGTKNYFETVNEQFEIYSRSGSAQYGNSFNGWFGVSGSLFDPKVIWDKTGSRFIFLVDTGSSLILSVAQQTNGLGNYCNYTFTTLSGYFADYPQLGVDANGIYFGANMYPSSGSVIPELFYANRSQMETCVTVGYTYWYGLTNPDGSYAFTIVPSVAYSSDNNIEYMVNSYAGGACQLTLWKLTSGGSLSNVTVATQCYSPPPPARQAGSSGTIETLDNRLYQAIFYQGLMSLDTVGAHDYGDGLGPVSIVEWFVLKPATSSLSSQGSFGTQGYWLFFPAMVRTQLGKLLFVYNASGPSIYPSIWSVSGCLCDTIAVAWGASYFGTSGTARWGDFQSAWVDPVPNAKGKLNATWVTGQYANGTNSWGTWADRLVPHT